MRFVKNILVKMLNWLDRNDSTKTQDRGQDVLQPSVIGKGYSSNLGQGLCFTMFPATGGSVLRFQSYDTRTNNEISRLYIITDNDDMGEEIAQIITKECLSRY